MTTEEAILDLPGLGPTLLRRLEHSLGGRQGVIDALDRGDVVALSGVTGVSRQRAVKLVQAHRGEASEWLRTDHARSLSQESLSPFLSRAVTRMGRAALETLAPTTDPDRLQARLEEAQAWMDRLEGVELEDVLSALKRVGHPATPRPRPERDVTVLVEEGPLLEAIREEGLDRWVDVTTEADGAGGEDLVLAATLSETPRGSVYVPPGEPWEAVPWADLAWARANQDLLEALASLAGLLEVDDHATPILATLDQRSSNEELDLAGLAKGIIDEANQELEQRLQDVTISGTDVLEMMRGGRAKRVESLVNEVSRDARKRFEEATGLAGAPITDEFPLEVDRREVERLERQVRADRALDRFRAAVEVAEAVRAHRTGVDRMVSAAVTLDRWQAAYRACQELDMCLPELGEAFQVAGALHLELEGQGDPVDYQVPNGVALLTGANSGGKTTLLETLGQIALLTHLGLPVPAREATVPRFEGLAYYARPRQLGAGAFEAFLRTIEPMLLSKDRVLVLADELEAMTELEAASAIIAEVVTRLQERACPTVLVTHLAPFILEHVEVRVDGIEAKGLDEDNELVVDRTPRIGTVARSTPELILQRLRNAADGEREALYEAMLARLGRT